MVTILHWYSASRWCYDNYRFLHVSQSPIWDCYACTIVLQKGTQEQCILHAHQTRAGCFFNCSCNFSWRVPVLFIYLCIVISINSPPNSHGFQLYKLEFGRSHSDILRTVADCHWQQVNLGSFSTSGSDESTAVGLIIRSITSEIMRGETTVFSSTSVH